MKSRIFSRELGWSLLIFYWCYFSFFFWWDKISECTERCSPKFQNC